ncbi:malto-oligosyltrehalose trehalohydrolase [Pedobacter sp.]|uniref:malto-oligosyltrehalose trehalohydrolase n=1 Tax=Pedobacter sp. TaxID=1411316 RepID=UPI003D7FB2CE
MDIAIESRNIGLNLKNQQASVRVWAPLAKAVSLKIGEQQILPLKPESGGYWSQKDLPIKAGDAYWFILDEGEPLADPASLGQPQGVHGASAAMELQHVWEDQHWTNIPLNDYIIYEIHTGAFSADGTFAGIINRLDELVDLGITAIEIMPVASFPGSRNWGYDGVFPFAVQQSYGGAKGLQELVSACHQKGLAVILDVVYNHMGPEGNYLEQFGPYFTDKYHTPWGKAVNFDDQYCDGVRDFVLENAMMWFRDFHIDALRLDAVHAIKDFSARHILEEISTYRDELQQLTGRKYYLLAESDLNDPRYISPVAAQGLGMDAQWIDEFHHALRVAAGEKPIGYYQDFKGIAHLAKAFTDAYVYTGEYSEERKRTFGRPATNHPGEQFIVFSQNHDQVGNRMLGERSSTLYSVDMQKLLAAAVIFSPYLPLLFMGEEYGETNPFLYFVSHTDPALIELVRKGRREEFAAMHSEEEAPDPQAEATFQKSKLNWHLRSEEPHHNLLQFYKQLLALRKSHPVLRDNDRAACKVHVFEAANCLLLERGSRGDQNLVLCFLNFSSQQQSVKVPAGIQLQQKIVDSAAATTTLPLVGLQPQSFTAFNATYV